MKQELLDFLQTAHFNTPDTLEGIEEAKHAYLRFVQNTGIEYCNFFALREDDEAQPEIVALYSNMNADWIEEYESCDYIRRDYGFRRAGEVGLGNSLEIRFGEQIVSQLDENMLDTAPVLQAAASHGFRDAYGLLGFSYVAPGSQEKRLFGVGFGGAKGSGRLAEQNRDDLIVATFAMIRKMDPIFNATEEDVAPALTRREMDVLHAFTKGLRRDRVAFDLGVSCAMVDLHSASIRRKLKAQTMAEAVGKAFRYGLL